MKKKTTFSSKEKALTPAAALPIKVDSAKPAPLNAMFPPFFDGLLENREALFTFFNGFPLPMEVFGPDGVSLFVNQAILKSHAIPDSKFIVGKYNILEDPVVNDKMKLREKIQRAFKGEATFELDVDMPIQNLVDRGIIEKKPFEKSFMDYYLYPLKKDGKVLFVIFIEYDKKLYYGRPDLARAKAYMDEHWQEDFDKVKLAKAVGMSTTQLYRVFTEHAGIPPGDYYKQVKVEHLKVFLADKTLSIKEAFAQCGESSRGNIAKVFKEITELSPTEYRMKFFP